MEEKKKLGRPPKYTKEEAEKRNYERHKAWDKANYERMTIYLPIGMRARINEAAQKNGLTQRQFMLKIIEESLKI